MNEAYVAVIHGTFFTLIHETYVTVIHGTYVTVIHETYGAAIHEMGSILMLQNAHNIYEAHATQNVTIRDLFVQTPQNLQLADAASLLRFQEGIPSVRVTSSHRSHITLSEHGTSTPRVITLFGHRISAPQDLSGRASGPASSAVVPYYSS